MCNECAAGMGTGGSLGMLATSWSRSAEGKLERAPEPRLPDCTTRQTDVMQRQGEDPKPRLSDSFQTDNVRQMAYKDKVKAPKQSCPTARRVKQRSDRKCQIDVIHSEGDDNIPKCRRLPMPDCPMHHVTCQTAAPESDSCTASQTASRCRQQRNRWVAM